MAIHEHWVQPNLLSSRVNAHHVYTTISDHTASLDRPSIDMIPLMSPELPNVSKSLGPPRKASSSKGSAKADDENTSVQDENFPTGKKKSESPKMTKLERGRLAEQAAKQAEMEAAPRYMNTAANMALEGNKYSWMTGS